MPIETKQCIKCGETKPLDDYHRNHKGYRPLCRVCHNEVQRAISADKRAAMPETSERSKAHGWKPNKVDRREWAAMERMAKYYEPGAPTLSDAAWEIECGVT
jgi:hypothetical protein